MPVHNKTRTTPTISEVALDGRRLFGIDRGIHRVVVRPDLPLRQVGRLEMSGIYLIGSIVSILLFAYLLVALLKP